MQLNFFEAPPIDAPESTPVVAAAPIPPLDPHTANYRINGDLLGQGGQMTKVKINLAAIALLKRLQQEGRQATYEEQKELVLYTGWGHTAQPFHPLAEGKWAKLQAEMRPYFSDEEWRSAAASTPNAHYTSPEVIRFMWQAVERLGFAHGKVLEPALGAGHFFGLMPEAMLQRSKLYGCELDELTGRIAKLLYPSAHIRIDGFEEAVYELGFFDLGITNVPFANVPVYDPKIYENGRSHLSDVGLHNYYFIKTLDLLRPGGLLAFITSRFTMDSQESKLRRYLTEVAHFLGAIRLPVTAFKKNAHTEVTTDIILLLKKDPERLTGVVDHPWLELGEQNYNAYYELHPEMMLGEMQQTGGRHKDVWECVPPADFDLERALAERLELLPQNLYQPARRKPIGILESQTFDHPPTEDWVRLGSYAVDDHYRVWQCASPPNPETGNHGLWKRPQLDGKQLSRVRGLVEVRDAFHKVVQANLTYASDAALKKVQQELAIVYRKFVSKWGFLHETANIAAFSDDADADNILALERWDPDAGRATKAAIFTERLIEPDIRVDHVETAAEALALSLRETGEISWGYIRTLYDRPVAEIEAELGEQIYQVWRWHPAFKAKQKIWIIAEEYLSGNVREKLAEAREWAAEDPAFQRNVEALERVIPRDMEPKEIFVQMGATWIPAEVIEDFIRYLLDMGRGNVGEEIGVHYLEALGIWRLDTSNAYRTRIKAENTKTWGTARMDAFDLIEHALNGQMATIYDVIIVDKREKRKVNQEATLAARGKQTEIKNKFEAWIWTDESRANRLVRLFNDTLNSVVPRRFDGSHLNFPGMNPALKLRDIQRDVIWRGLQSRSLMMAHQVGFGKTFSQIGLANRLKGLKLRQRIMLVVKRATFAQFVEAYRQAYPFANITTIASGQSQHQRRRQLARIVTENFEAIITTHPIFSKIPLKPDTLLEFLHEQLAEVETAILRAKGTKVSTKELEKAKRRIEAKIKTLMDSGLAKDPNTLYFEDLGLDALIVDEAQAFKNLWFPTIMTRVAGIGGTESGRAYDMFLKIQILKRRKGFIAFATGTPLENSISEVYTMMRFLIPEELRRMRIYHFDAWAATFGKVVTAVEMKPDGSGFQMKARFASFNNLPQLKQIWWQAADVQMDAEKAGIDLPELVGGKPIGIEAKPFPELKRIVKTLANRANRLGDVEPWQDNMLLIMNHADKASLDPRLLGQFREVGPDGKYTGEVIEITGDYAGSKVNLCAQQVAEIYHRTTQTELPGIEGRYDASEYPKGYNLAQLIFLDTSVAKEHTPSGCPGDRQALEAAEPEAFISVYGDLKKKLIALGVKESEIAFAQDYSEDDKKAKLAAALNAGRIRVAIGSTEVMGIGLNCQRLLVALHHLDCPWKPAWIEQREGRIKRQGNLCRQIAVYRYVMAESFDVYRWQTVERKYSFIVAFNSPDLSMLSVEDPGMAVLSAREMTALATGNPKIIEQIELQTRLRQLKAMRKDFEDTNWRARNDLTWATNAKDESTAKIKRLGRLLAIVKADENQSQAEAFGRGLYALCEPYLETTGKEISLGELYGMAVSYKAKKYKVEAAEEEVTPQEFRNFWGAAEGEGETPAEAKPKPNKVVEYRYEREITLESREFNASYVFNLRISEDTRDDSNAGVILQFFQKKLPNAIEEAEERLDSAKREIVQAKRVLDQPYTHDAEIREIEEKLILLDMEIKAELGEVEAEDKQAARVDMEAVEAEGEEAEESEEAYDDAEAEFE